MSSRHVQSVARSHYLFALVSGALLALSFPRYGHPACAWVALVPMFIALSGWDGRPGRAPGQPPLRALTIGLLTGAFYFLGTLYWTHEVLANFGGLSTPLALLAMLLVVGYQAMFPALAAVAMGRMIRRGGTKALFLAPAAWVAAELLRGSIFGGFPWVLLGNTQVTVLPVAQLASVAGVYGLSALVAYVSAAIAYAMLTTGRARVTTLVTAAAVVITIAGWGTWRLADGRLTRMGTPLRVGLVQGNIAQDEKWDPKQAYRNFTTHLGITRDVVRRGAQYVIWPESSTPFLFEEDQGGQSAMRDLARETGVPILFGSDQVVRGMTPLLYNSAFVLRADGQTAGVYRKMHLVPFGEFIPLKRWLSFASPLVGSFTDFSAGAELTLLPVGNHLTSTAICYEAVFPSLARRAVLSGSELLTTITNDGWYGRTSAPYQHFALASMRAIEQGRYLARAANTGISGVVDPYGRVVVQSPVFQQIGLVEDVRFLTERTIYSRFGDVVAYAAVAIVALALIVLR